MQVSLTFTLFIVLCIIEEIKSEKKSGPDINDYIKYIADTEDPIKTFVGMLK